MSSSDYMQRYRSFKLCKLCRLFFKGNILLPTGRTIRQQIFDTEGGYEFARTRGELSTSASDCCLFCQDVWKHYVGKNDLGLPNEPEWSLESRSDARRRVILRIRLEGSRRLQIYHGQSNGLWPASSKKLEVLSTWYLYTSAGKLFAYNLRSAFY